MRSTAIVSAMTLLSRISGFIRDMIIARFFGADAGTDAFFVAFKIPDFLRRLFSEGAFSQALVPVLMDYKANASREVLEEFIGRTAGSLAFTVFVVSLIGVIAAPVLIWIFAPGFAWHGEGYEMSVALLRITVPYLFFISCTALAASLLNSFGHFAIPAITPLLLNLCMIAAALGLAPHMDEPVFGLACGVFAAGVVQLAFQIPALHRLG
ncbi:MAG: murein biosynthesis integral membrane protein MurJ, partial [Methylococcales bacterium]